MGSQTSSNSTLAHTVLLYSLAAIVVAAPVELAIPKTAEAPRLIERIAPFAEYIATRNPKAPAQAIARVVVHTADWYQVDPVLVLAVIECESFFNPRAVGPLKERGLMQLTRSTARSLGLDWQHAYGVQPNVEAGVRYLNRHLTTHHGNVRRALTRYNGAGKAAREYAARVLRKRQAINVALTAG